MESFEYKGYWYLPNNAHFHAVPVNIRIEREQGFVIIDEVNVHIINHAPVPPFPDISWCFRLSHARQVQIEP